MKYRKIVAVIFAALFLFAVTSCSKGGCPNKLDVDQPEQVVSE